LRLSFREGRSVHAGSICEFPELSRAEGIAITGEGIRLRLARLVSSSA
jgi:hypothetical protein